MSGKAIVLGLALIAAAMAGGLWFAQEYAYWREVDDVARLRIGDAEVAVSDYRGIEGESSPLRMRGCFTVDPAALDAPPAPDATPLIAPSWFDCFDAAVIGAALNVGDARAVVAETAPPGFRRIVAVFPDGRAFQWREVVE
jgi:hypothetical protein